MRADGKRVRNADPMHKIAAYIMDKRVDSMNMTTIDIPIEPIKQYLGKKRQQGINISHMSVILAAYIRTMKKFPELNRFVVNKKIYQRNEIAVGMVVLKPGELDNGTMSKMYFNEDNTIFEVNDIINKYVAENREAPENNGTEKIMKFLLSIPGLLPFAVKLFKWMDKHGWLPKSVIDMSPFHMSLGLTNLASINVAILSYIFSCPAYKPLMSFCIFSYPAYKPLMSFCISFNALDIPNNKSYSS